jgi:RNA polymerase primary sigma factor
MEQACEIHPGLGELLENALRQGSINRDELFLQMDLLELEPEQQAAYEDILAQSEVEIVEPPDKVMGERTETPLSSDIYDIYRRQAGAHRVLKAEEEIALAQRIEQGDAQAFETMVVNNLKLVMSLSRMYENRGLDRPDLVQEGNIGLMRAVKMFDWRRGYKFSTYATWWIRQGMQRAVMNKGMNIRLPVHVHARRIKIKQETERIQAKSGDEPDLKKLVEQTGYSPLYIVEAGAAPSTVSADKPVDDEGSVTLLDFVNSDEDTADTAMQNIAKEHLRKAIDKLSNEEREVLGLRFGLDDGVEHSHRDIATLLHLGRTAVPQIESRALGQLAEILVGQKDLLIDSGVNLGEESYFVDDDNYLEFVTHDGRAVSLTVTEANIMRLVTAGMSYEAINKSTGIANKRVRAYVASACDKLCGEGMKTANHRRSTAINTWLMLDRVKETGELSAA